MKHKNDINETIINILNQLGKKPWVLIIQHLVNGAHFSYASIAREIGVSSSTIQQLAVSHHRRPRYRVLYHLLFLYYEIFYSPEALPKNKAYLEQKGA